jgi:hypothetical protein
MQEGLKEKHTTVITDSIHKAYHSIPPVTSHKDVMKMAHVIVPKKYTTQTHRPLLLSHTKQQRYFIA